MRAWLLFSLALSLLPTSTAAAAPPIPTARELVARVEALARIDALDATVKRPLAIAQRALNDARAAHARGAHEAAGRDEAVALAAIELAEARLRLVRERALLRAAEGRRREATRELARGAEPDARPTSTPR